MLQAVSVRDHEGHAVPSAAHGRLPFPAILDLFVVAYHSAERDVVVGVRYVHADRTRCKSKHTSKIYIWWENKQNNEKNTPKTHNNNK